MIATIIGVIVGIILLVIIGSIFMARRTVTGEAALAKMTADEKAYLHEKLVKIRAGSTYEDAVGILGEPMRGAGTQRPIWLGPGGDKKSQIAAYCDETGKIRKLRWMKLGVFVFETGV